MTEYWKSVGNYYCDYCKVFVRNDAFSRRQHEASPRHEGSLKRQVRDIHRKSEREARELAQVNRELAKIGGKVAAIPAKSQDVKKKTDATRPKKVEKQDVKVLDNQAEYRNALAMHAIPGQWASVERPEEDGVDEDNKTADFKAEPGESNPAIDDIRVHTAPTKRRRDGADEDLIGFKIETKEDIPEPLITEEDVPVVVFKKRFAAREQVYLPGNSYATNTIGAIASTHACRGIMQHDGMSKCLLDYHASREEMKDMPKEQRAYIACLYCRQRKSKCIIDESNSTLPGRPRQCKRCARENRHCVITNTRKSGRESSGAAQRSKQIEEEHGTTTARRYQYDVEVSSSQDDRQMTPASPDGPAFPDIPMNLRDGLDSHDWQTNGRIEGYHRSPSPDEAVAGSRLQNPCDALELLARVARRSTASPSPSNAVEEAVSGNGNALEKTISLFQDIVIPTASARSLLFGFKEKCHPFFPIANEKVLDEKSIEASAHDEPHLLLVILTIAAKQDLAHAEIYNTCLQGLKYRLAQLVCSPPSRIEAVEALLLLAEWTPQKFETRGNIGSGEEDRAAWMQVGLAVRLGYLQGLDSASFDSRAEDESQVKSRRRVAWAACFMSDRLISVRVGKAFWSRGPGPSSIRAFDDYQPFQPQPPHFDDYSRVFQAHMELTKLLSNAHDVLYASIPHRDRLFKSGEYAKYIDDFRTAINEWHAEWGSITCSPGIKSSLILSSEYLRLYVSAFAYQATLSRLEAQATTQSRPSTIKRYFSQQLAGTPDARFIYESISAAKGLLSTFNCFVDPVTCLRYMPVKYYLYVIYAAVYLYKARATGALDDTDTKQLNQMIWRTIVRLQQSSLNFDDIGSRYSRLLATLWKKPLRLERRLHDVSNPPTSQAAHETPARPREVANPDNSQLGSFNMPAHGSVAFMDTTPQFSGFLDTFATEIEDTVFGAFDWNDLGAVGQFATANNSTCGDGFAPLLEDFETTTIFNTFMGQDSTSL